MNDQHPTIDHSNEFRTRALLPTLVPIGILLAVVGGIGLFAWLLLYNSRNGAVAVALMGAAGILVAIALAASQDELTGPKRLGVAVAAVVPIGVGAVIAALSAQGVESPLTVAAEELNINAEPHGPDFVVAPEELPEDTPILAAVDQNAFCLPSDGGCEPTNEWTVATPEDAATFAYLFNNRDTTIEHNLALYPVPEETGVSQNQLGEPLTPEVPGTFIGDETRGYQFSWPGESDGEAGEAPQEFYFVCTLHPQTMWGIATVEG